MKNLPNRIYVSMEGGDCILAVKSSDSPDFTEADYDFIDKQLFPLEEGECVEYVHKDAFIEKTCEWIKEHKEVVETEDNGIIGWIPDYFIEDFKKCMYESK